MRIYTRVSRFLGISKKSGINTIKEENTEISEFNNLWTTAN